MKKESVQFGIVIAILFCLMGFAAMVSAGQFDLDVVDEEKEEFDIGDLDQMDEYFDEEKDKMSDTGVAYKQTDRTFVYDTVPGVIIQDLIVEECSDVYDTDNKTILGESCVNVTYSEAIEDKQNPIALLAEDVVKLAKNNDTWVFDTKGCWVCGNHVACVQIEEYSDERGDEFKCDGDSYPILRSGEEGYIQSLITGEIAEEVGDGVNI